MCATQKSNAMQHFRETKVDVHIDILSTCKPELSFDNLCYYAKEISGL